jgi:hypothetical protein
MMCLLNQFANPNGLVPTRKRLMRKLRKLAAATVISVTLSTAAIAGDMQGPGYVPPPPPPATSTGHGDIGSPGEPETVEINCETSQELSAAESLILGLLTVIF